ncbi:MAG TPA: hypothetical protein VK463_21450 [Desulfomonilaceae bacterium]|nr:hypothetical protein [Desulfomonilaceae bacterium]
MVMNIAAVTELIGQCWHSAELATRGLLADRHFDADEEFITSLFIGELRKSADEATKFGRVREAFLQDLLTAFPDESDFGNLGQIAEGITAIITRHPRQIEAKTGGDMGVVLVRPNVFRDDEDHFVIDDEFQRGLMCQAKINKRVLGKQGSAWGDLTPNQKKVLPAHTEYLSLILYKYSDKERRFLEPFYWQLCAGMSIAEISTCLKSGIFPGLMNSNQVIDLLGNDLIGTNDKRLIAQYINPDVRPALIIRIGWPKRPPREIISVRAVEKQRVLVLNR